MNIYSKYRNKKDPDKILIVEHFSIFTKGNLDKLNNFVIQHNIMLLKINRGGKFTFHTPGQIIFYILLNIKRLKITIYKLINILEKNIINILFYHKIKAYTKTHHGVYILLQNKEYKIASVGLCINKGCSLHGVSYNVNYEKKLFKNINPCGLVNIKMIKLTDIYKYPINFKLEAQVWIKGFLNKI
ncbi:Octanoyltransferase [Candidatus Portiera aleyrodidarum]|uniref:Octanoyltransferase n=1 Tax=Candidatus Portiera aleyrodidarum TV TaxID=1297582 RepID=A0A8D3X715_9GAMM|nr:lipoyl(octanoyl) transferase LipB [Candidatus Portiera aleyrodidarum]AGI27181.1 lipoate-protein ligase B [Candidatus Portiera aleyrodidarum TV]CEI59162.1 Octanoyltransferase [Candidatus Portiera aleyrodidarum]